MENFEETLNYINLITNNFRPEIAIVLGSGLGGLVENIKGVSVKYSDIPNFPQSHVEGHKGELLFCEIENKKVVVMQGRFHFYEGYNLNEATYPIKIFKKLGVKTIILTNAAGATSADFNVGDIMLIKDHINFMGTNPLIGPNDNSLGERFPDMSDCYSKELRKLVLDCAEKINVNLKQGVYLATTGPSYETATEVKMFKLLGADVAGMSTVPEAIVANYLKMKVIAFSMITNFGTGISDNKLSHKEVLEVGKISGQRLILLIKEVIKAL